MTFRSEAAIMAIESGHWYLKDGKPFYSILSAKGEERPVTLREARKVNAVPSVTTVLQVIAKPQLEAWKVRQGILAALTLPRTEGEADDAYVARIERDSKEQAKTAAEEGSRIHDAIECSFTGRHVPDAYLPHVEATRTKLSELFPGIADWVAEHSFASAGFGGKVDLHSPSTGIVVDYKGKDGDFSDGKKLAYDQHYQLAAYRGGLDLRHLSAPCANIFVSRTHPGAVAAHVWSSEEVAEGEEVFLCALRLWQAIKGYRPV
jgi:hypothetical protein